MALALVLALHWYSPLLCLIHAEKVLIYGWLKENGIIYPSPLAHLSHHSLESGKLESSLNMVAGRTYMT